jgi:hypothetical protein
MALPMLRLASLIGIVVTTIAVAPAPTYSAGKNLSNTTYGELARCSSENSEEGNRCAIFLLISPTCSSRHMASAGLGVALSESSLDIKEQSTKTKAYAREIGFNEERLKIIASLPNLKDLVNQTILEACSSEKSYSSKYVALIKSLSNMNAQAATSQNTNHQAECLNARDYEGCMRFHGGSKVNEICNSLQAGWCIADEGNDILGAPKLKGLLYRSMPSKMMVTYKSLKPARLTVRGDSSRYISTNFAIRKQRESRAGRIIDVGAAITSCSAINGSLSCITIPPLTLSSAGVTGGVSTQAYSIIIDCIDKTYATYKGGMRFTNWEILPDNMWTYEKSWCGRYSELETSDQQI